MSTGIPKRSRSTLQLPPGQIARGLAFFRRNDVLLRIGLCALAALMMLVITRAWAPPFPYRQRYTPPRDIVARVDFKDDDEQATQRARDKARQDVTWLYANDTQPLDELQRALTDKVYELAAAEKYADVDKKVWKEFLTAAEMEDKLDDAGQQAAFEQFRLALSGDENLKKLKRALLLAFDEFGENGLLESLQHELNQGNQNEIKVYPKGDPSAAHTVAVAQVRIGEVADDIGKRLAEELEHNQIAEPAEVAKRLYAWLRPRLQPTLSADKDASRAAADASEQAVEVVQRPYVKGEKLPGIEGGSPLEAADLVLLRREYDAYVGGMSLGQMAVQCCADLGMYVALYILCGLVIYHRQRPLLRNLKKFITLLFMVVGTVGLVVATGAISDSVRVEIVPLMIFGLTMCIAYRQEVALLLTAAVSLVIVLALGQGLPEFVVFAATAAAAVYLTGRVRSRTKLIYVGLSAGGVAFSTALGVCTLAGQPLAQALLVDASWYAFSAVLAGLLMTGLLPFIEKLFDVQTDLSLLELGDVAHPLLQELVRRAPGTYNHSINVASIAEAAAEAISANGLLVRVGAYFHDIGKMLKPGYFIENRGQDVDRHESLLPAMSTLVIIAHVKDGADLARKHHLPKSIINFIEQHHGTTLVEFFYDRATRQSEANPDGGEIDESSFRYPGPKPQSREAGIMMLADAVESASRTLVDPTPSRIEGLVHDMAMKRLLDGQFDECSLTLREIHLVSESLVKSLTAVYHGRVKYPEKQQTA